HRTRIVLVHVHLGEHRTTFRFHVVLADLEARHALRLDPEEQVEMLLRHGGEIRRLVRPRIAVPLAAAGVNGADDPGVRKILGIAERHVLEEVRDAGLSVGLVARADAVQHLHARDREIAVLEQDHGHAVAERFGRRVLQVDRRRRVHDVEEQGRESRAAEHRRFQVVSPRPVAGILSARARGGRQGSSCKSPPVPAWTTRDGAAYTRTPARTKESRMKRLGRIAALAATSVLTQAAVANDTPHQALARDILAELVAINTAPSGGPDLRPAAQAMAARLRNAGFAEDDITVVESTDRIVNLVARYRSSRPARRPLLMMAHIDVVEALPEDWTVEPYELTEKDGWFYGRGTTDNKAG